MRKGVSPVNPAKDMFANVGPPRAREDDPETSQEAAAALEKSYTERDMKIVSYIARCGPQGATSQEAADALHIPRENLSSRLTELERAGLLWLVPKGREAEFPGVPRVRLGRRTNRPSIVYRIVV